MLQYSLQEHAVRMYTSLSAAGILTVGGREMAITFDGAFVTFFGLNQ